MRNKKKNTGSGRTPSGFENIPIESDFYSGSPTEQPLNQDRNASHSGRVRKTGRHMAVQGRRKETVDPREKMALLAILKTSVMILLLIMAFFLLWKGIKIYEESVWLKEQVVPEPSPVLRNVVMVEDFDIEDKNARALFADRVEIWKEADRLVRSADNLLKRNNYEQAITRCQDALKLDPAHVGALERLGRLYVEQGMIVEAINSYIRLLSVDPSRKDHQEMLLKALNQYQDDDAVIYVAKWYNEQNPYNENVQRYLANALLRKEDYPAAVEAYERVLKDAPEDTIAMAQLADVYMILKEYGKALEVLERLREFNYREQRYYRKIVVCNAQMGRSLETVQTLGKAAHLFGQNVVIGWIQDPMLDPVREDRTFQAFADRVGGEEFRKWLEKVAKAMDGNEEEDIAPQLNLPEQQRPDATLLQRNNQQ